MNFVGMISTIDPNWPLLVPSFVITLVLCFSGTRVRQAALSAKLASAPLLGQIWRTMPFKALLFFAVLGVVLRGALLGGLFITAAGMFVGSGFLLLADRIPNIPLLGKLLVILLAVAGMLIILAAMTLGIATFLTMAWDGFVETSKLFGI